MSRFKKLIIENFQSHVHTELTFHPGLNVLVGPSDSGKSAILRALRWVLFNYPRGMEMIREGASRCQVTLELDDGTKIIRTRSKSINRYTLIQPDQEELILEGFGSEVPQEVVEAHGIRPIRLEKQEIFLQLGTQLEGPFLLSESGGTKAKMIGMISGAQLIDRAIRGTATDRNQLQSRARFLDEQVKEYQEKLVPYQNLEELGEKLSSLESRFQEIRKKEQLLRKLQEMKSLYQKNKEEHEQEKRKLVAFEKVLQAEKKTFDLEKKAWHYRQISAFANAYRKNRFAIQTETAILQKTDQVDAARKKIGDVLEKLIRYQTFDRLFHTYQALQKELQTYQIQLESTKNVPELFDRMNQITEKLSFYLQMKNSYFEWKRIKEEQQNQKMFTSQTEHIPSILDQQLPKIKEMFSKLQDLKKLQNVYQDNQTRIQAAHQYLSARHHEIRTFTNEYVTLLKRHGKCPTCGAAMNLEALQLLIKELNGGDRYAAVGRSD